MGGVRPTLISIIAFIPQRPLLWIHLKIWRLVRVHGTAVGLPTKDDIGNSEVGHNALGAGRIFAQGAKLVDIALETGKIYDGEGFNYIKESFENGTLQLIGLLSDGASTLGSISCSSCLKVLARVVLKEFVFIF